MVWLFWLALIMLLVNIIVIIYLVTLTDMKSEEYQKIDFPPVLSEVFERKKKLMVLMFVFAAGLMFLNFTIVGFILSNEYVVGLSVLIFFATLGIFAFDVSKNREMHYLFVIVVMFSTIALAGVINYDTLYTNILYLCTIIFVVNCIISLMAQCQVYPSYQPIGYRPPMNKAATADAKPTSMLDYALDLSQFSTGAKDSSSNINVNINHNVNCTHNSSYPKSPEYSDSSFQNPLRAIYTLCETLWLLSLFLYFLVVTYHYKDDYYKLMHLDTITM